MTKRPILATTRSPLFVCFPILWAFWACWLLSSAAWGADFHSARTVGLSGAGHGGPILNDSIYLSPAFASFLPTYSFAGNYLWFNGESPYNSPRGVVDYTGRQFNVSLQDGRSEMFQAGVGYTVREDMRFIHIGAAKRVVQQVGFGLGAKMTFSSGRGNARDLTFSSSAIPFGWLQLALVVDNILQTDTSRANGLYRQIVLGTKTNIKRIAMVYLDPHYTTALPEKDGGKLGFEGGLEFTVFTDLFARGGFFTRSMVPFQGAYGDGWSIGGGWVGPKFSLDYGMKTVTKSYGGKPKSVAHTFGLTLYM